MTHENRASETKLPKFSVNVAPVDEVTAPQLRALLNQFRDGSIEPLVLGRDNTPEAAVIPFAAFIRLLKYDHAATHQAEAAFQNDLSSRVQQSDAERAADDQTGLTLETDEDLFRFAESLGEVGQEWAREQRADDGHRDDG